MNVWDGFQVLIFSNFSLRHILWMMLVSFSSIPLWVFFWEGVVVCLHKSSLVFGIHLFLVSETRFGAIFKACSYNIVFFFLEDVSHILPQLLDFFLLFNDFILQKNVLVLHLGIRTHLAVSLLHWIYNIALAWMHTCLGHTIVGWGVKFSASTCHVTAKVCFRFNVLVLELVEVHARIVYTTRLLLILHADHSAMAWWWYRSMRLLSIRITILVLSSFDFSSASSRSTAII